jgi:hypothetical protein
VWAFGNADWGRLGDGVSALTEGSDFTVTPTGVCALGTVGECPGGPYLDEVSAIAAGGSHSLALLGDGTVLAWGENESGQLGVGTTSGPGSCTIRGRIETERVETRSCSPVPVAVEGLSGIVAIAAGAADSLALSGGGTVTAWGANSHGQLGDKKTASSDVPVAVSGLTGVVAIAAGGEHNLALLSNGTVMAWGSNASGQLGDGTTTDRHAPVAVSGLSGVVAISAGGEHSLALLSDGTVEAWGANNEGQLGDGSTEPSDVPVAVTGLSGVSAVSAGGATSLALLGDGTVRSWGTNGFGQLGFGGHGEAGHVFEMLPFSDVPVEVCAIGVDPRGLCRSGPFLTGVRTVSAGSVHSIATTNATTVAWGNGCQGELGVSAGGGGGLVCFTEGDPGFVPVVPGGGLGIAKLISAGGEDSLAFGPPLPTVGRLNPTVGLDAGGEVMAITGTELSGATAVHFGSVSAPSFTVNSDTSITALSPAEATGVVPVTVTTPAGTTPVVNGVFLHYIAAFPKPVVKRLVPTTGPSTGGTAVLITGTGFFGEPSSIEVHFGTVSAASVTINELPTEPELNSLTAVSPPGVGIVPVTVTTLGGTSVQTTKVFKYGAPTVKEVTPNSGPKTGGTTVTVTGTGFLPGAGMTSFKFGGMFGTSVNCASTTTCTVVTPAVTKAATIDVLAAVGKLKSKPAPPGDRYTFN